MTTFARSPVLPEATWRRAGLANYRFRHDPDRDQRRGVPAIVETMPVGLVAAAPGDKPIQRVPVDARDVWLPPMDACNAIHKEIGALVAETC